MKKVISLYIGQAGVQIGNAIWELLSAEHGIDESGSLEEPTFAIECIETFFGLTASGKYVPRALFVDLEPSVIDEVRSGAFKNLFHPDRLITGPEDAASNFARGFFTVGKLLLGTINNESRRLLEGSDSIQGIFLFRSLGGGTGAGLTSAIFDGLAEYPKITKIEVPIYPSPTLATAMVEPYNCLLGEHFCMEDIDVGLLLDNEALYDLCARYLTINYPTFTTINRLIAQLCSSITASVRFENVLNCDITVLQTNLVPYPRIHFPLANFAPVLSQEKALHEELSVMELTRYVFERENQMMKVDHSFGRFMSCSLLYRGNISPFHVYQALSEVKKNKNIEFVDWCPTGFKVGINVSPPTTIPASLLAQSTKNVTMLTNTSAIGQAWQRLTHKFYLLYSKRSFVHWFIGEGMEECEFTESLYNISALVKDYEEAAMDTKYDEEENPETSPASGPATVGSINHDNAAAPEEDIINKEYTPSKESENNDNCEALSDDDKEEKGQVDGEIKNEEEKLQESAVEVSILEEVDNEGPNPEEFNAEETSVKDNIGETNVEEANDEVNAEEANEDINAEEANDEVNTEEENEEVNAEEANEEVNAEEANEEVNAEEEDEEVNAEEINEVNVEEGNEEVNVEEVNEEVNAEEVNEEEANDEEINVQDETNVEDKEEGNEEAEEAISEESGITEEEDQNNDNQTTDTEGYYINEKGKIYQNYSNIQMKSRQDNGGAFENSSNGSDVYFNLTRSSWPQDYVKFDRELDTRKSLE